MSDVRPEPRRFVSIGHRSFGSLTAPARPRPSGRRVEGLGPGKAIRVGVEPRPQFGRWDEPDALVEAPDFVPGDPAPVADHLAADAGARGQVLKLPVGRDGALGLAR